MKNLTKILFAACLICLITLTSCQNDPSPSSNKITANSTLKTLLSRVTQKRTSSDNAIDSTSCFTIKLPVTIIVNNLEQVVVTTQADYDVVLAMLNESDDDYDHLQFVFPITIIYADFTELVVSNSSQFHQLREDCEGDDVDNDEDESNDDDDNGINCISLTYPFIISTTNNSNPVDVTINNDHDLYVLLDTVEGSNSVTINYPISIVDSNGVTIVVENNNQLEENIVEATTQCGNDDSNDDNDNDEDDDHDDGDDSNDDDKLISIK